MTKEVFTIGDLAELLDVPEWRVRRTVDRLGVTMPRAGAYRLVPRKLLPVIIRDLRELGYPVDVGPSDARRRIMA